MASYTANLASLLVTEKQTQEITSIDNAIDAGMKICVPDIVETSMNISYPLAKHLFVFASSTSDVPRLIHRGDCGAGVLHLNQIADMHAGGKARRDCKRLDTGKYSSDEAQCKKTKDGQVDLTRDCGLLKVGDVIMSMPVGWPVSPDIQRPLSVALVKELNSGLYVKKQRAFEYLKPVSVCQKKKIDAHPGIPAEGLLGTLLVSSSLMAIAFAWTVLGAIWRKLCFSQQPTPAATDELNELEAAAGGQTVIARVKSEQ